MRSAAEISEPKVDWRETLGANVRLGWDSSKTEARSLTDFDCAPEAVDFARPKSASFALSDGWAAGSLARVSGVEEKARRPRKVLGASRAEKGDNAKRRRVAVRLIVYD